MPILTPEERVGTTIADKYELRRVLGQGGMGVVFEGVHLWTGRPVALKILKPDIAQDVEFVKRFLQEARAAARLEHPHVVEVLDMGRGDDGTVYQALELLDGCSLADQLRDGGTLDLPRALHLLLPIGDALETAHRAGIVHRDVKPDNVFLRRGPRGETIPVLLDFGVAKLMDAESLATRSGALFGTPHYMAPEQAAGGKSVGPAADVYAMGVMLYRCLSGELPLGERSSVAYLAALLNEQPRPLREVAPGVPQAVADVVDSALSRQIQGRPASMAALLHQLLAAARTCAVRVDYTPTMEFQQALPTAPAELAPSRPPKVAIATAVAVLSLAAAAFGIMQVAQTGSPQDVPAKAVVQRVDEGSANTATGTTAPPPVVRPLAESPPGSTRTPAPDGSMPAPSSGGSMPAPSSGGSMPASPAGGIPARPAMAPDATGAAPEPAPAVGRPARRSPARKSTVRKRPPKETTKPTRKQEEGRPAPPPAVPEGMTGDW